MLVKVQSSSSGRDGLRRWHHRDVVLIGARHARRRLNGQQLLRTVAHGAVGGGRPLVDAGISPAQVSAARRPRGHVRARVIAQPVQMVVVVVVVGVLLLMLVVMRVLQSVVLLLCHLIRVLVVGAIAGGRHDHAVRQVMAGTVRAVATTCSLHSCGRVTT